MLFLFKNEVVDYNFYDLQKKETIIFLHGWGGNKFSFNQTISLLKNQYNILSVTMPSIDPTISIWNLFDYASLIENLLSLHSIKNVTIVCHSFGFRIAMILNKKIEINKIVVTGGAGLIKENIFKKITTNNNKILLKNKKFKHFYKFIASDDYLNLSQTNKETFKNIVNLNLKFVSAFNCPMLLFWGKQDKETGLWIAKHLKKHNKAKLFVSNSDHFAYLKDGAQFNHETLKFIKNT